jgi:hypothetical protein
VINFKCLRTPRKEVKRWLDDAENDLKKMDVKRLGKIAKNIEGQDLSRTVKPVERKRQCVVCFTCRPL